MYNMNVMYYIVYIMQITWAENYSGIENLKFHISRET